MNYGVTILDGAKNWQIFQQDEQGYARVCVRGGYKRIRQSFELPLVFTEIESGWVLVKARIAREDTGEGVIPWTKCELTDGDGWEVEFQIPAGGLYRIETYMEYEGWDGLSSTRGDMVHNLGVGDVFVIAGQSNAAGRAKTPVGDAPQLGVHVLRPSGMWDIATHPLADTTNSIHTGNFENHNPGHTPWLRFAKRLMQELGYPIGLVPCAYGGAPLRWWNPQENGSLLENMLAHLAESDVRPKAVLWYQGEAEGHENAAENYLERFSLFVNAVRERLSTPELYFLTVQLNRCVSETSLELDRQWGMVRQAQRDAAKKLKNVAVVPANDIALYDFIHNSSEGDLVVGERVARAALALLYQKEADWKAPEPETVELTAPDTIHVVFSHIRNWLNPYDVPAAHLPFDAEDADGLVRPVCYATGQNDLSITFERPLHGEIVLHGAWRMNTGGLIPCDCMRMPMLSFYRAAVKTE